MSLTNYRGITPMTVILDDDRDPHVSWQNHLDRAGRGGVDVVARVGTPVYAPTSGVMDRRRNDGSAGNSCRFKHDDNEGWADVFSHLSGYVGYDMQHFNRGDIIAYTGNTGGVTEHLHWHLLDPAGRRQNPWDHFTGSSPAGDNVTPITELSEEDDMKNAGFAYTKNGIQINIIANPVSGFFHEYEEDGGGYNSGIARAFDTGNFETISESHAQKLAADCALVRAGK